MAKHIELMPLPTLGEVASAEEKAALAVYQWAEEQCVVTFAWYMRRRTAKARASKFLRSAAVLLAVTGSAIPFYVLASGSKMSTDWGYLALLLAAGCLLMDRGFGFSSSWARYVSTALAIEADISNSRVSLLSTISTGAAPGKSAAICSLASKLISAVNKHVSDETTGWVVEFQGAQEELRSKIATVGN